MNAIHTTKGGDKIPISDMSDSHLINTIAVIQRKADSGITLIIGGCGSSADDMWADEQHFCGKEALELMRYSDYKSEARKRGL